jgi:beta-glucosidase
MMRFPDGFLWGAATAGHQVEGGNASSDMWEAEWAEGSRFAEPSGDACDHYHRYPEDIAALAALGLNAYRFSVEWARIEPEEGFYSRAALDHYRRMVAECLEHDVTPVVTYSHFATPRWFAHDGGFSSPTAPDRFARFAERVTAELGDLVPWVCTFNEPNIIALVSRTRVARLAQHENGGAKSENARRRSNVSGAVPTPAFTAMDVDTAAALHRRAVEVIKSGPGNARVGWTLALSDLQPVDGGDARCDEIRAACLLDWLDVSREDDFVGVQTYSRTRIAPNGGIGPPDGAPTMQNGLEAYPEALEHTVRLAAEVASVPVLVTENGMATDDDEARIAYVRRALEGIARCAADGVDVRGYLHWSLLDNFEWASGFAMKFGLIAVDRTTFTRTVKPSARWLGDVARANAVL